MRREPPAARAVVLFSAIVLAVLALGSVVALGTSSWATERVASPLAPQLWRVRVTPPWGEPHYELCARTLDDCTVLHDATEVRLACQEPLLVVTRNSDDGVVVEELVYDPRSYALASRARIDARTDGDPPTWLCTEEWIFSGYGETVRARRTTVDVAVVSERSAIGRIAAFDRVDGVFRAVGPRTVSVFDEARGTFERATPPRSDAHAIDDGLVWALDGGIWVSDGLGRGAQLVATPGPGELRVRGYSGWVAILWHAEVTAEGDTEMAAIDDLMAPLGGGTGVYLVDLPTRSVVASARWPSARTAVFSPCDDSRACRAVEVSWADRRIRRTVILEREPPAIRWDELTTGIATGAPEVAGSAR